ncbi:MAG: hypothetical protein ACRDK7_15265 [Solirubrobacteraceae bacterium]
MSPRFTPKARGEPYFQYAACATLTNCPGVLDTAVEESSVYGAIAAIQEIGGLAPQTTYSYRLVADNAHEENGARQGGETVGAEQHFTTGALPEPVAVTGAPSGVGSTSAMIAGTVNPDGQPSTYVFELGVYSGAGTRYGVVFSGPAGESTTPVLETLPLSGLQPGTTYAYRLLVKSGDGQSVGSPVVFTTEGLPTVLTVPVPPAMLAVPAIAFPAQSTTHATVKALTRKQKLTAALRACARKRAKKTRAMCDTRAHKRYGTKTKKKAKRRK